MNETGPVSDVGIHNWTLFLGPHETKIQSCVKKAEAFIVEADDINYYHYAIKGQNSCSFL